MLFLNPYSISLMFRETMLDHKTKYNSQNINHSVFNFVCGVWIHLCLWGVDSPLFVWYQFSWISWVTLANKLTSPRKLNIFMNRFTMQHNKPVIHKVTSLQNSTKLIINEN